MRTVDAKAQKSMPLVEEGSVKAKAEKTGGGSMRLVDGSMKSKAGECLFFQHFILIDDSSLTMAMAYREYRRRLDAHCRCKGSKVNATC
jgi:hypothetical protein